MAHGRRGEVSGREAQVRVRATRGALLRLHGSWPARVEEIRVVRSELRRFLRGAGADEDVISDVLVACSEACGNAIRHAVEPSVAAFEVKADADHKFVRLIVRDFGRWREKPVTNGDRSYLGLSLMCSLMDDVRLRRTRRGTFVRMRRSLNAEGFAPTSAG